MLCENDPIHIIFVSFTRCVIARAGRLTRWWSSHLVKAYVDKYKHARKHKKEETGQIQLADIRKTPKLQCEAEGNGYMLFRRYLIYKSDQQ